MNRLAALAWGRIALGVVSYFIPEQFGRVLGVRPNAEMVYMSRVYGARAITMGTAYLTAPEPERRRWHRLGLAMDTTDTISGLITARTRAVPIRAVAALLAITGGYAVVGAHQLIEQRRNT